MSRRTASRVVLALAAIAMLRGSALSAQETAHGLFDANGRAVTAILLAVDLDDDDEDRAVDASETASIPTGTLPLLEVRGASGVRLEGPLRAIRADAVLPPRFAGMDLQRPFFLQALGFAADAAVVLERASGAQRIPVRIVTLRFLDGANRALDPSRDALGVAHAVTNDPSLPRPNENGRPSRERWDFRIEAEAAPDVGPVEIELVSRAPTTGRTRDRLPPFTVATDGGRARGRFVRLVADDTDAGAPGVAGQVLRVALRDVVEARMRTQDGLVAVQRMRVGRPGSEGGPSAALRGALRVRIVRMAPHGAVPIGRDDAEAMTLGRSQVATANEIWLQCFVGFGDPTTADVAIVDPPPPSLIAIADGDGLPAAGGGVIRFSVNGRSTAPIRTVRDARPVDTAVAIAQAVTALGFEGHVFENARTEFGAGRSADVFVTDRNGVPATIAGSSGPRIGTDARQRIEIGVVDLHDGITEFDNMTASAGTLEERALLRAVADGDPSTLDLVIINAFSGGSRQGEAFIEGDGGSILDVVLLDRNGIRQDHAAWTQSHEIGHVLLDHPFHPDNLGDDRPWLLMDADASLALVVGPKRLTEAECARARYRSGPTTSPALLRPAPDEALFDVAR